MVRVMIPNKDMAELRAGTNRHLGDRRWARSPDSCDEVVDLPGGSTSYARCMRACLVLALTVGCAGGSGARPRPAALRYDLGGWRALAAELHGRSCACRTLACVDGVGAAIDQLEQRTPLAVQGDETAALSVTRARECLFRLRGKAVV